MGTLGRPSAVPPDSSIPHQPWTLGISDPRSLELTSKLEDRVRRWNEDWRHGFIDYGQDDDGTGAALGLPSGGFALPEWADDVDPVAWYRAGRAIAAHLADELPSVAVRLAAVSYLCAPRFLAGRQPGGAGPERSRRKFDNGRAAGAQNE